MPFTYRPAVYAPGASGTPFLSFPCPVVDLPIQFQWVGQDHRIPLKEGGQSYGYTAVSVPISISGEVGVDLDDSISHYEDQKLWEYEMWRKIIAVKNLCNAQSDANPLELFLYYDADISDPFYIKFKDVRCRTFDLNIGDTAYTAFSYTATFIANDTTIYTTAPGA